MGSIPGTRKTSVYMFEPFDERLVLITDPTHRLYDKRVELPVNEAMVESIANEGMLQAISVRKVGDNYEVVVGRQRVKAAREAARRYPDRKIVIKAMPATLKDIEVLTHSVIENVQRVDDSPSIRGFNAARLRERGYGDEELERIFGVRIGTIEDWIAFYTDSTPELREALDNREVSYTDARKISKRPMAKQVEAIKRATESPRPRPGPKKGTPRRRKIVICAYEREEGGFEIKIDSKCRLDELGTIIEQLDAEFEVWKSRQ